MSEQPRETVLLPVTGEDIELLIVLIDDSRELTDAEEEQLRGIRRSLVARRKRLRRKLREQDT